MGLLSGIKHLAGGLTGAGAAGAAKDAARAQQEAMEAAIRQYQEGYTGQQALFNPYVQSGAQGLSNLNALNSGDYSGFNQSPDYLFALQQGNEALGQNQAARGNLFSGGAGREIAGYNQGLATQNLGNYRNALNQQIGYGQYGTSGTSNALSDMTHGIADARMGIGDAKAGGYIGAANAWANGASNLLNLGSSFIPGAGSFGGFGGGSSGYGSNAPTVTSNTGGGLTPGYGGSLFGPR